MLHPEAGAMRHDDEEEDPKKPHPVWIGRKGTHAAGDDEEHAPREVEPDDQEPSSRYHHMHVRC